jgi:hypothetical protein
MPPPPVQPDRPDLANPHHVSLILRHRNKILASPQFIRSRQLQQFLNRLVQAALECGPEQPNESVIGDESSRRPTGFDPASNPLVRPDSSRLRAKLNEYYNSSGVWDTVRFTLRKGGRVLDIEFLPEGHAAGPAAVAESRPAWALPRRTLILIALAATALGALAAVACHRF